jgi:hypothetical protein
MPPLQDIIDASKEGATGKEEVVLQGAFESGSGVDLHKTETVHLQALLIRNGTGELFLALRVTTEEDHLQLHIHSICSDDTTIVVPLRVPTLFGPITVEDGRWIDTFQLPKGRPSDVWVRLDFIFPDRRENVDMHIVVKRPQE